MQARIPFAKSIESTFHGKEYIVNIKADDEIVRILIEEKYSYNRWKGEYTSTHIQEMTQKAGNEKKYAVFLKMMLMALERNSETVFIDFLTSQDIQLLREKRSGTKSAKKTSYTANPQQSLNRYVILTYATEFEKVHFPLVLTLISRPDPEWLKRVFKRVSDMYRELKSFDGEARSSGFSTKTNEFFRTGMANYNPTFEENKQLK